jgi:AraC-like DNA-binding protein/ligand-binding sensor protein
VTLRASARIDGQKWVRLTRSEVVRQFQMAFAEATGLPVTMLPVTAETRANGNQAGHGFCIEGCLGPDSGKWCQQTLQGAELEAVTKHESVQFRCPSGLVKILVPVWIGEQHVGSVMVGPFSLDTLDTASFRRLDQRLKKFGLQNETARLRASLNFSPVVPRDKAAAASELVNLFAKYLSESANTLCLERAQDSTLLKRVEACLEELQEGQVESRHVAQRLQMSPCHFCKLFKQQTGMTFSEFRLLRRVEKARKLLLDPRLRISEIAYECEFGSVPYFVRAFRRQQGCSPTQYRAKRRPEIQGNKTPITA